MQLESGDRVIATNDISTGFIASVRKGTQGTVINVHHGWFSDTTTVTFDDGQTVDNPQGITGI